jgi:hypothetical protein
MELSVIYMQCIYFTGETCEAASLVRLNYKPNEEEKKKFCESESFRSCPRHMAFLDYLRAEAKK